MPTGGRCEFDDQLAIRMPSELANRVRDAAAIHGVPFAEFVRQLLDRELTSTSMTA